MKISRLLFLMVGLTLSLAAQADGPAIRCAFDIGSGETKVAAAPVGSAIADVLYKEQTKVSIKKSVKDGVLPEETITALTAVLARFKKNCEGVGATQFIGVATSGFRLASKNGAEALARVGLETSIELRIVTGEEEGVIGYRAIENAFADRGTRPVVVWDVGGGSMQFATLSPETPGALISCSISTGASTFSDILSLALARVKDQPLSPLTETEIPIALEKARALTNEIPEPIKQALRQPDVIVVGVGGAHFDSIAKAVGTDPTYTLTEVIEMRGLLIGKDLPWIQAQYPKNLYPHYQASNAILISGMMEALGIQEIRTLEVNLTQGLLRN